MTTWALPVALAAAALAPVFVQAAAGPAAGPALERLRAERRELAFKPRGILMNNDGCDVLYYPREKALTAADFLARRTTGLAGTGVGAIAYCTISSGFSFFTHDTKVGTLLDRQPGDFGLQPRMRNIARELIDQGADCLKLVVDHAHAHGQEAFWSMRMNDTHDSAYHPDRPYLLYPPLKVEHPEWLVGDPIRRTPYGRWSSVNYAVPEIRELAFRYLDEVCRGYDIDGIEMDFFRHLCYFPNTANGGVATAEEAAMMTDLMRRVRAMTEVVGLERGRPILVAIRVPDSAEFSREMGLDIEGWMAEGLVDILVTSCYFRLQPWGASVALGQRHGVAVYPGLSESRVTGETRFRRGSLEALRGRATNAWQAGANGLYLFNHFNPASPLWKELASPAALRGLDKLFHVTVRDGRPGAWLAGGERHLRRPILTPGQPLSLEPGRPAALEVDLGEDLAGAQAAGLRPRVTAHVRQRGLAEPGRLAVALQGQDLGRPAVVDDWLDFAVPPTLPRPGANALAIALAAAVPAAEGAAGAPWTVSYEGTALPGPAWSGDRAGANTLAECRDGALLVADRGVANGDYLYFRHGLAMGQQDETVIEARVKVVSGTSSLIFGNGTAGQRLRLYPDRVEFHHDPGVKVVMNTTDDFHTYRLTIRGEDVALAIDGTPRLEGKGCFRARGTAYRPEIAFGAASSTETGEALWAAVRARSTAVTILDLVFSVRYGQE